MEAMRTSLRALLFLSLFIIRSISNAAELAAELRDGWHSWDVPAGDDGKRACCYHLRHGKVGKEGCHLGPGADGITIDDGCTPVSDTLRVYVLMEDGDAAEIRALSSACPVATSAPVQAEGELGIEESIEWLDRYAHDGSKLADEAVTAIALHEDESALKALAAMVEDRGRGMDVREQALFWIAQSDHDAAFAYLDRLLSAR